jgi:holliday junction DNA helicase RuvA
VISRLKGVLVTRDPEGVEIETSGGVVYEVEVPLTVLQRLPKPGSWVELRTVQVVTDSSVALYGFMEDVERTMFQRLLTAQGVGARLALALLSAYSAVRLARALVEKDLAALQQVSGVGRKKAEKLVVELADKVADLAVSEPGGPGAAASGAGAQGAVKALVALGYSFAEADQAVRRALGEGGASSEELIRRALSYR